MSDVSDARRLAGALEPIAGQAQFSPECHRNYEALGFPPSPGRAGLTALPDRCAFFTARGAVLGITRGTTAGHLARAAVESMAYQTCDLIDAMQKDAGLELHSLKVDGGAAVNDALLQFQADVLGVEVADAVVVTVPLGVLKAGSIGFTPSLPAPIGRAASHRGPSRTG